MPKIVVRPLDKGLRNDRLAFNIDNDSFPFLLNAYQWRGRVKRKRGTSPLTRLTRQINTSSIQTNGSGAFTGNILTGLGSTASVSNNGFVIGSDIFTDTMPPTGVLTGSSGGTGTINYATGALAITGAPASTNIQFQYFPGLPVMGLEDLNLSAQEFPSTIAFDTTYSYSISNNSPYSSHDVTFYKNPSSGFYTDYMQKSPTTPFTWNGQNYQQFWTVNYEGAFWATNGLKSSSDLSKVGMQFKPIVSVTIVAGGPPAKATLEITGHGLLVGDFVFVNEVITTTGINFQTGFVTVVTDDDNVVVEFPTAVIATDGTGGIAQYLTNTAVAGVDCIRWYDGDPTTTTNGWVNFMPPLSQAIFSISDEEESQYYLVGAVLMLPFKDRLLFIGPVIQNSGGNKYYLQDTVVFSENGTAFYTCTFTGSPTDPDNVQPILTPGTSKTTQENATPGAWFEDSTGFGGSIKAGYAQPILTASTNEDVLILGFSSRQARFVYTGSDWLPFNFFIVNSEYGSISTFSAITLDRGVVTVGNNGIILTSQISSERIDLEIPDQIFQFSLTNSGFARVCAQRDFIDEWIYFTYQSDQYSQYSDNTLYQYPNQTLFYNYRDNTWAMFNESFTTYGVFREQTGDTWSSLTFPLVWRTWDTLWSSGSSNLLQPVVIAGNGQGFVVFRTQDTDEAPTVNIQNMSGNTITSIDHMLNAGDYILITGAIGITPNPNGNIYQVLTASENSFTVNATFSGTYGGLGVIQRLYIPQIMTKQFPIAWDMARKTRIGPQQYLLTTTQNAQITLQIFLSMDSSNDYNFGPIVPSPDSTNNSLVYSNILYTCPESTNLGLTPANTNLQMITYPATGSSPQQQIWHRVNTSLIGDTVQLGFTLSPTQMTTVDVNGNPISQFAEIELHGIIIDVTPSQALA
jgi:hypothetical protein